VIKNELANGQQRSAKIIEALYLSFKEKSCSSFPISHSPGNSFGRGIFTRSLASNSIIAGREYGDGRDVGGVYEWE